MFHFLRGTALVAAMLLSCGATFAEPSLNTAWFVVGGCRPFMARGPLTGTRDDAFNAGRCSGIVETLIGSGALCLPEGVTFGQAIRVVVKYIDDRPARMHEHFTALALEALQAVWPCKN
jgi:hypothetical protein